MIKIIARSILAVVFAILGLLLASALPLASPFNLVHSRIIYALIGGLLGFLIFVPVTSWAVKTTTRLSGQLTRKIASEVINQFTHLTSSGLSFFGNPSGGRSAYKLSHPIILDTSAIIDGRILDIAKVKFISGVILVPNFVLTELQGVSDSSDILKRNRGRRGFEIIDQLKKLPNIKLEIWERQVAGKNVDDQLIRLGKILKGKILTVDYNLNRVASVSSVDVLNVNELANAIKTIAIPGDKLSIKVMHIGKNKTQGVGYLEDGTMVVVEDGSGLLDKKAEVEVTKILQVPTGRMIFAKRLF